MTKDEARTLIENEKTEIRLLEEQIIARRIRIREVMETQKIQSYRDMSKQRWAGYGELLSPRHVEVIGEVVKGKSNREISQTLFVTEKTVKFHLTTIYKKLNVRSRAELMVLLQMDPQVMMLRRRRTSEEVVIAEIKAAESKIGGPILSKGTGA